MPKKIKLSDYLMREIRDTADLDYVNRVNELGAVAFDFSLFFFEQGLHTEIYVSKLSAKLSRSSKPKTRSRTGHNATSRNKTTRKDTHV